MRRLMTAVAMTLFAANAHAADDKMTIAVFTKNRTNPAYEAFRIASDQIARATGTQIVHYVPKQPDSVDEQIAMVDQVLKDRPDAVIFVPVDDVAIPRVRRFQHVQDRLHGDDGGGTRSQA
jgi:ribose transport system substrate-binding protein